MHRCKLSIWACGYCLALGQEDRPKMKIYKNANELMSISQEIYSLLFKWFKNLLMNSRQHASEDALARLAGSS